MSRKFIFLGMIFFMLANYVNAQKVFNNLDSLIAYSLKKSITIQSNGIREAQAKKAKLAAAISVADPTGNAALNYTMNTQLPVSLFPDANNPGKYTEVQIGQKYNAQVSQNVDVKLLNFSGWESLKLANINVDLTSSNSRLSIKSLSENIAANYWNIVNLQEQISNSRKNLAIADTILFITQHKYKEGLVKAQDVNDAKVNALNTLETINQLEFLLKQYYISLKIICDIPDADSIEIRGQLVPTKVDAAMASYNGLSIKNSILKEQYALSNYKQVNKSLLPVVSFNASNGYQLYSNEFKGFDGKWYANGALALKLSIPIPNSQTISNKFKARYDYQLAQKTTEQEKIKADLNQAQLNNDYNKANSQYKMNQEIMELRQDSYNKKFALYTEGLLALEQTLNSYSAKLTAEYNAITALIQVRLAQSKIDINNKIN